MEFHAKKFAEEEGSELLRLEFEWVSPFVPVYAPVYLHLAKNKKFLAIKGPLDFFLPSELERYYPFELLFLHPFVSQIEKFRIAGRTLLRVFSFHLKLAEDVAHTLTPYEISDQVLMSLGPLFGEDLTLDPYFAFVTVQELLGPLDPLALQKARDASVAHYECGLLYAAWATWVALLYGWTDILWLRAWRDRAFARASGISIPPPLKGEAKQLEQAAFSVFSGHHRLITAKAFYQQTSLVALKLCSRLDRIKSTWNAEAGQPEVLDQISGFGPASLKRKGAA